MDLDDLLDHILNTIHDINDVNRKKEILTQIRKFCIQNTPIHWGIGHGEVPDVLRNTVNALKVIVVENSERGQPVDILEAIDIHMTEYINRIGQIPAPAQQNGGMRRRRRYSRKAKRVTRRRRTHSRKAKKAMRRKSRKARMF